MMTESNNYKGFNKNTLSEEEYRKLFLSKIDTDLIDYIPDAQNLLSKIPLSSIIWFLKYPLHEIWFDHLVLALISIIWAGNVHVYTPIRLLHQFLSWSIPRLYPDLNHLVVNRAIERAYTEMSRGISCQWDRRYGGCQVNVSEFLRSLTEYERKMLMRFTLPKLIRNEKIRKARLKADRDGEKDRKELVHFLMPELNRLVILIIKRYLWLIKLTNLVDEVKKNIFAGVTTLPVEITTGLVVGLGQMSFRIWNLQSWESAHQTKTGLGDEYRKNELIFIELMSEIPDDDWFFKGVEVGLIHNGGSKDVQTLDYLKRLNISSKTFWYLPLPGMLSPITPVQKILSKIKRPWVYKRPKNIKESPFPVLFCLDSLLVASSIGILSIFLILNTTMRMGELQQISLDDGAIRTEDLGFINNYSDTSSEGNIRYNLLLFPKALLERKSYHISNFVFRLLLDWCKVHQKYSGGEILEVEIADLRDFKHAWKYEGKHKFIFQWNGRHLSCTAINACITFLTLNHNIPDLNGKQLRITSHLFRHCSSTLRRSEGTSLEELMQIMVHFNIFTTDYYSKPSDETIYKKVQPILNTLGEKVEEDPKGIRGIDELISFIFQSYRKFGCFLHIQGGFCGSRNLCKVKHQCASCAYLEIIPERINEIIEMENCLERSAQSFDKDKQALLATIQRQHAREWKQIEAIAEAMLSLSPHLENNIIPDELLQHSIAPKTFLDELLGSFLSIIDKGDIP